MKMKQYLQGEELIEILEILGVINKSIRKYIIMSEESMNQEFKLKKIDDIRNYPIEEINWNKLLSKKLKRVSRVLNYIEHSLILISTITGCISISTSIGFTSSTIGLKICVGAT